MLSNGMISTSYYSHGDQTLVCWPYPQNVITTPGDDVLGDFTGITGAPRTLCANLAANISLLFFFLLNLALAVDGEGVVVDADIDILFVDAWDFKLQRTSVAWSGNTEALPVRSHCPAPWTRSK